MTGHGPWGVSRGWWGVDGAWHEPPEATRRALEDAQGAQEHPDGPPPGDPLWFVTEGEAPALHSPATLALEDGGSVEAGDRLPHDLPLGAHLLHPADGGPTTRLFVVPERAPSAARGWGWSAQLYGVRSAQSWGHGDLVDLGSLAATAAAQGAALVAHNPLGATIPVPDQEPSPYYASTRRFTSPLYLRVESVLGADLAPDAVQRAAAAGRELCEHRRIRRDRVWALKLAALEAVWAEIRSTRAAREALDAVAHDEMLSAHAVFCALAEQHGAGWPDWPTVLRHPESPEVRTYRASHRDRVDFWRWIQVECDVQLAHAAASGAGLMGDVPVGFDPAGFDAWMDQDQLALGCRIGAPPDELGPQGQDWGLPPYVPWKLRSTGYASWRDTLRRSMRHSAALRIDHVMGLFRLFWIPPGGDATQGGYVYLHDAEMLDVAAMEAARSGTVLIGEDLGTVEGEVREAMARRDVYGYRVGWFAEDPPPRWPAHTLGMLTSHDLPTVAGLWTGVDAANRAEAGLPPSPEADHRLLDRLAALAGTTGPEAPGSPDATEVVERAHAALASAGSDLVLATLEDALAVRERPNLPGTVDERPNWRLALPVALEDLGPAGTDAIAATMREIRR